MYNAHSIPVILQPPLTIFRFLSDYVTYHFVRSRNSHHRIVTAVMQLVSSDVHAPRLIFKLFIDVLAFLERGCGKHVAISPALSKLLGPTPVFTVEESITIMKKLDSIVSSEILEENEVMGWLGLCLLCLNWTACWVRWSLVVFSPMSMELRNRLLFGCFSSPDIFSCASRPRFECPKRAPG